MICFQCDNCGKMHQAKPELAGKVGKCPCGSRITIPLRHNDVLGTNLVHSGALCPNCQYSLNPEWNHCPICLLVLKSFQATSANAQASFPPVQPTDSQSVSSTTNLSDIQVGNQSVATISVNKSVNIAGAVSGKSGAIPGIAAMNTTGGTPSVQVGNGSVVNAEINASVNIGKIEGDIVQNKTVSNTNNQVINITNKESILTRLTNSSQKTINKIENDFDQSKTSVEKLKAFVARQIAAIEAAGPEEMESKEIKARYSLGKQAIALLIVKSEINQDLRREVEKLKKEIEKTLVNLNEKNQSIRQENHAFITGIARNFLISVASAIMIGGIGFFVAYQIVSFHQQDNKERQAYLAKQQAKEHEEDTKAIQKKQTLENIKKTKDNLLSQLTGVWISSDNNIIVEFTKNMAILSILNLNIFSESRKFGLTFDENDLIGNSSIEIQFLQGWDRFTIEFLNIDEIAIVNDIRAGERNVFAPLQGKFFRSKSNNQTLIKTQKQTNPNSTTKQKYDSSDRNNNMIKTIIKSNENDKSKSPFGPGSISFPAPEFVAPGGSPPNSK